MSNGIGKDWDDVLSIIQNSQEDMRELLTQWTDFVSPTIKDVTFVLFDNTQYVVPNVAKVLDAFSVNFTDLDNRINVLENWRSVTADPKISANESRSTDNETEIDNVIPAIDLVSPGSNLNGRIDDKLVNLSASAQYIRYLNATPSATDVVLMQPDTTNYALGTYYILNATYFKNLGSIRYQFWAAYTLTGFPAVNLSRVALVIPSISKFGFDLSSAVSQQDLASCTITQYHISDTQQNEMKSVFCRLETTADSWFGAGSDAIVIGPQDVAKGNAGIFGGAAAGELYTSGQLLATGHVRGEIWTNFFTL